ncbi:helix-turn-helix domain-containing protein [Massilia mucilaginosa]|uniref:helix-turn-helix domain-containing protein n=1 Tax=Massilia mucilaginosa TaxID=2609282 RepID=UPI001CB72768
MTYPADALGLHVTQVKRYEAGASLPSLEAVKNIAQVLRVTTDFLIFEETNWRRTPTSPGRFGPSPACRSRSRRSSASCWKG